MYDAIVKVHEATAHDRGLPAKYDGSPRIKDVFTSVAHGYRDSVAQDFSPALGARLKPCATEVKNALTVHGSWLIDWGNKFALSNLH